MLQRPLYRLVADQIEARIVEGRYTSGSVLPAESVLEREFSVSRITIRQALGLLKRRGILASRSGLGTFVRSGAANPSAVRFTGTLRELIYYAAATRYTPLGRGLIVPPADIADHLKVESGKRAFCFTGKRGWPGGADFCLEEIYVPEHFGGKLDNSRLGKSPLFAQLEELNQVTVTEVEQIITAVSARAKLARDLGVANRAPLLKAVRIYRMADRRVAEVSVSHYDPARFKYVMSLFLE
jgi:GntR family transcriptional regulator